PTFFLAPLAGVLVDRWDRHRTLVVTQALALVQSALLAVVAFQGETGAAVILQITALSLAQGTINAFDMPARQVLLVQIAERREDLPNAIALNSFPRIIHTPPGCLPSLPDRAESGSLGKIGPGYE